MNDRLVLSSGYFNLAGGRRQDSADSFRVNASLKTHAGDVVGFYAVTEASTPGPLGERARRLAVDAIQGDYASRFDLQPGARLKAAVQSAHHTLVTEFGGQVSVGLTVLVGHGPSLYLLQVPPSQAYVVHDGSLHSVSAGGAGDGAEGFANALGSSAGPRVSRFRDTIEPLDTIVLCSSWFARELEPEELRVAFAPGDAESVTANLFRHARELDARDASCVALHAATEDAPPRYANDDQDEDDRATSTGVWSQVDEAVGSISYLWQRAVDELRAPGSPVRTRRAAASTAEIPTSNASLNQSSMQAPAPNYYEDTYDQEPVLDDIERAPHRSGSEDAAYGDSGTEELPIATDPFLTSNRTGTGDRARAPMDTPPRPRSADLDEVNNFIQSTLEMSQASPSVQGFSDTTVSPERIYPASRGESVRRRRSLVDIFRPRREKIAGVAAPVV
ncbi:MAG TPA: hypothetical protein VG815_09780, partial [Chloroflexota bacterium]|nr:hypothetical protein [Chloroflexota bacterium]